MNGIWGTFGVSANVGVILTGAVSGAITSGSLRGAVIGAFSASLNLLEW
jgi:hypothetical protein